MERGSEKTRGLWLVLIVLVLLSILVAIGVKYNNILSVKDVVGLVTKKLEVLSRMRIHLLKSVEAEKMAVMADTDESSKAFADQAEKAAVIVDQDRRELDLLIRKDSTGQEIKLLQEFDQCFREFREIDQGLLEFAVLNSNLKAARLSFGQGQEVLKRFEEALDHFMGTDLFDREEIQCAGLASKALTDALKIHYLHGPHIAETGDEQMDKIEAEIKKNQGAVNQFLKAMRPLVPIGKKGHLKDAEKAFEDFSRITAKVITLSRQNTNIKSFELSLGRKRKITAQCDEILIGLEEAVRGRSFKATR